MKSKRLPIVASLLVGAFGGFAVGVFFSGGGFGIASERVQGDDPDSVPATNRSEETAETEAEAFSPLVGTWGEMREGGNIPTRMIIVEITEDGVYHWLNYSASPINGNEESEVWQPNSANVEYSTGRIDLATGKEIISPDELTPFYRGVTWSIEDDLLWWRKDMGSMGGERLYFWPIVPKHPQH